ncbi:hypothetical protein [Pedobacter sp. MW01-1-1]|uniref:hypothetical protein n=1 Tax=Pedobacter sp. MW01-1-1 TaxID=3383027 RepID=UPI003FF00FB8
MFRKIQSNRAPDRTIPTELYHEFRPYLTLARRKTIRFLKAHPKHVFILMILLIVFSVLFSFDGLIFKEKKKVTNLQLKATQGNREESEVISDGLMRISSAGIKLRKTLKIRKQVDSVLAKTTLNNADTVFLEAKLEELRGLN